MAVGDIKKDLERRMNGAIESLHNDFRTLRTGRANASMLDGIVVEYYGTPTPLAQCASIAVPEPALLVAQPWDKSLLPAIEKAIRDAQLGLNPANDGKVVRIPIPPLTEERRKEMTKKAHAMAEEARTAVRQVRRDGNDKLKKMLKDSEISEDDEKRALDEIQKMTDRHIDQVNEILKHKEQEIMAV
jgi:ribosome recycling factor